MTAPTLIMGARGGIGEALARRLAAAGQPLVLSARDPQTIQPLAQALGADVVACDVLDTDSIKAAVQSAQSEEGLAGLAYCVGNIVLKPLKNLSEKDLLDCYRLNTVGAAIAVQAAAPALQKARGSVVMFSTVAAGQGFGNHAVIAAAKGGVEALARSLAADLAPSVRVNCIAPSISQTEIADSLLSNEKMAEALAASHPLKRVGVADDSAAMAAFLLGTDASWITGQVFPVDGGRGALRARGQ
ncbi:SDR family NAD(P)-dependent oxidoreductase [Spiribacter roseus]|uniref:SDR family NAD(P)-dependent oxidoreductase n=1 Tax=Spiribacter roseus TaxID=1855875 RepID=UPI0013310F37|nr:SDR family oxidoreductase [Spiribacter roseus]KAF0281536.1 short-chain dehydrogenase [Spiribacter roseus]